MRRIIFILIEIILMPYVIDWSKVAQWFITYWTQIVVFLGAIGFILKYIFENRSKRRFKRFEIYEERKLESMIRFHATLHSFHVDLNLIPPTSNISNIGDKRDMLEKIYKEFQTAYFELHFFLGKQSSKTYNELYQIITDMTVICFQFCRNFKVQNDSTNDDLVTTTQTELNALTDKYFKVIANLKMNAS